MTINLPMYDLPKKGIGTLIVFRQLTKVKLRA